jgi:outer membrane protein insertion porin family
MKYYLMRAFLLGFTALCFADNDAIKEIRILHSEDVDVPAILDLLGLKQGDSFNQDSLDRGLSRLALTNNFQRVDAEYDTQSRELILGLDLHTRLESVEIVSNQKISNPLKENILADIGLNPGDIVTADMLTDIRIKIKDLLEKRGLLEVEIIPALQQYEVGSARKLRVFVQFSGYRETSTLGFSGMSTSDLRVLLEEMKAEETFNSSLKRINVSEFKNAKLKSPLILDFIALEEVRRRFLKRMRDKGYYDSKIEWELMNQKQNQLDIHLAKGPKYNIQFKGNVFFWENDLRESILERSVQLGLPFSMFEAELRINTQYKERGFKDIKIQRDVIDEADKRLITFNIKEGTQYFLGQTLFKGIPLESEALMRRATFKWLEPYQTPYHYIYYLPDQIVSLLGGLVSQVRDMGYLDFKIFSYRFVQRGNTRFFDLELTVQLGQRYQYGDIQLAGLSNFEESKINSMIDLKKDDYVSPSKVFSLASKLKSYCQNEGFIQASVSSTEEELLKLDPSSARATVSVSVNLGPKVVMGKTIIDGNNKTKDPVILRELKKDTLVVGQSMGPDRSKLFEQNLYGLGLFQLVEMRPVGGRILQREDLDKGLFEIQEKDLKVAVKERAPGSIEFGPGYRTDLGLIGFAELNYRNLGGWNRGLFLRSQASRKLNQSQYQFIEQKHTAVYVEPYLFDWPLRFRTQFEYSKSDDIKYLKDQKVSGFNSEELSLNFSVEKEIFKNFTLSQTLYEYNISKIFDIIKAPLNRQNYYRIASVGSVASYDLRDNVFEPRKGFLFQNTIQWAIPELGGDDEANFVIWRQKYSFYVPIPNRAVLALSAGYSRLWGLEKSNNVPENKRLVLGGRSSIRSLSEKYLRFDQKGVLDQQSYEFRSELRQPLFLAWGMAVFFEGGEVNVLRTRGDPLEKLSTGFRKATGVGLRYSTPVGPLAVDFAFNIDQEPGENEYRINLSIGSF